MAILKINDLGCEVGQSGCFPFPLSRVCAGAYVCARKRGNGKRATFPHLKPAQHLAG